MYADEMTSYPEIINVVESVFRMQDELPALRNEVATASDELTRADGMKKTIARCRLKDAETALAAKMDEIDSLGTSIPAPVEIPCSKAIERIALLRINRDSSKKVVDLAKSRMDAETAKGTWRPKGAKPSLGVLYVQKEMEIAVAALEEIDREIRSLMREVDAAEEHRLVDAEMYAWIRGNGPRPRILVERDRKEWEEFNRTATRLVVPRRVKDYSTL